MDDLLLFAFAWMEAWPAKHSGKCFMVLAKESLRRDICIMDVIIEMESKACE